MSPEYFVVSTFTSVSRTDSASNNGMTLKSRLGSFKVIENSRPTTQTSEYGCLFAFHSNYGLSCIILKIKRYLGRKSRFFIYHLLSSLDAPVRGFLRNTAITFGVEKNKMV